MVLTELELRNIRLYEHAKITPDKKLTILIGGNGQGKTTLLEAIHFLSTGKSFRATETKKLLRHGRTDMAVYGHIDQSPSERIKLTSSLTPSGHTINLNGLPATRSSLAQRFPVLVISPENHHSFQQSSIHRRSSIDWLLFHVEQEFYDDWYRYQRILQQRNAALKTQSQASSRYSWDIDLARTGERLKQYRNALIHKLAPIFQNYCNQLFNAEVVADAVMHSGWKEGLSLEKVLYENRTQDLQKGFTHYGPHRADLKISFNNYASRYEASNGQNKLLLIALRLAQIQYLKDHSGKNCCLLIDDFAAELDKPHRQRLLSILSKHPGQTMVTSTGVEWVDQVEWPSQKTFHVEQGKISSHTC